MGKLVGGVEAGGFVTALPVAPGVKFDGKAGAVCRQAEAAAAGAERGGIRTFQEEKSRAVGSLGARGE